MRAAEGWRIEARVAANAYSRDVGAQIDLDDYLKGDRRSEWNSRRQGDALTAVSRRRRWEDRPSAARLWRQWPHEAERASSPRLN